MATLLSVLLIALLLAALIVFLPALIYGLMLIVAIAPWQWWGKDD